MSVLLVEDCMFRTKFSVCKDLLGLLGKVNIFTIGGRLVTWISGSMWMLYASTRLPDASMLLKTLLCVSPMVLEVLSQHPHAVFEQKRICDHHVVCR
jgi:hypothetical protein